MKIDFSIDPLLLEPYTNFAAILVLVGCVSGIAAIGVLIGVVAERRLTIIRGKNPPSVEFQKHRNEP